MFAATSKQANLESKSDIANFVKQTDFDYKIKDIIPDKKCITCFTGTTQIESWKSEGNSEESIVSIAKLDGYFGPTFVDNHLLPDNNFNEHCLIKNNIFILKKLVNLYISYTLGPQLRNFNKDFTLGNCLFESVKVTKNTDLDKNKYNDYGIGFDPRSELCLLMEALENVSLFLELI